MPLVKWYRNRSRVQSLEERIATERDQKFSALLAERDFLLDELTRRDAELQRVTAERESIAAAAHTKGAEDLASFRGDASPEQRLIELIAAREDLTSRKVEELGRLVESKLANPLADRVGIHREIGRALFARSARLYCGDGLPSYLARYSYPPVLSVALSSHCNAACFFCRPSDYKGDTIDFDNIFKLENAIRNARCIDLTGWGEPFFYPRFEEVLKYIASLNDTRHLIQITSNGSFLSERWGKLLSGKLSRLIISINAASPETYSTQMLYKNSKFTFERTVDHIREFQAELTPEDRQRIFLHMVANTGNFRDIVPLVRLAKEIGVPTVNVGNYICAQEEHLDKTLWNIKEEYNAEIKAAKALGRELGVTVFGREFFNAEEEVKGAQNCLAPFEQFFVEMPGTTAPCCFMGTERMGNVYTEGFEQVWFSDLMNRLRTERFLPPCQVCTVFTPFDNKVAHMSAFLTTRAEEVVVGGGPQLGSRKTSGPKNRRRESVPG